MYKIVIMALYKDSIAIMGWIEKLITYFRQNNSKSASIKLS
jgi:hypothetical protein